MRRGIPFLFQCPRIMTGSLTFPIALSCPSSFASQKLYLTNSPSLEHSDSPVYVLLKLLFLLGHVSPPCDLRSPSAEVLFVVVRSPSLLFLQDNSAVFSPVFLTNLSLLTFALLAYFSFLFNSKPRPFFRTTFNDRTQFFLGVSDPCDKWTSFPPKALFVLHFPLGSPPYPSSSFGC